MVYITGDMHGEWDRFKDKQMRQLKSGDVLIVCGDFGFIWDGTKQEKALLRKIAMLPFTVAFLDGCHENFDLLARFPVEEWNGGPVHRIAPNIVHLIRGHVFTIENRKYFAFGGGHSQDYEFRCQTPHWWEQEQPTPLEIKNAIHTLAEHENKVDYILTHEPPASLKDCLGVDVFQRLEIHTFFEDIIRVCQYRKWFFGKCHIDKYIPMKFFAVFEQVVPVTVKDTDL
ncbi:MAG: metallophosphoesterase [Oscillospiraceae bacterium]|jgi:hypothetical protein|nr:metallophosphoesterase [Oscillospiraceae bacterium]MBQ8011277.1 metallophosphoesterase [Oscillospiraceae bacterium]MBQ9110938.1 metallophosphoesterase [Oscillospiraceae bacterium]